MTEKFLTKAIGEGGEEITLTGLPDNRISVTVSQGQKTITFSLSCTQAGVFGFLMEKWARPEHEDAGSVELCLARQKLTEAQSK